MLNKQRVAQHFSRAAETYARHNALQVDCGRLILSKLAAPTGSTKLLDAGCGPAAMTPTLLETCNQYTGLDIAPGMLAYAQQQHPDCHWVLGDIEALPFAPASFDRVVSNLAVQWCTDLMQPLQQMSKVLKPGGRAVLTTVLADSMQPLMQTWQALDGRQHGNKFLSASACARVCDDFSASTSNLSVQLTTHSFEYFYPSAHRMLKTLKGIGANYRIDQKPALTAKVLKQLEQCMAQHRCPDGLLPMRWEIALVEFTKG